MDSADSKQSFMSQLTEEQRRLLIAKIQQRNVSQPKVSTIARIERQSEHDVFPLSFVQEQMWYLNQLDPDTFAYNATWSCVMTGHVDRHVMEQSLNEILKRHEILRSIYVTHAGAPAQQIVPHSHFSMTYEDLTHLNELEQSDTIQRMSERELTQPLRLSEAPLMRAVLMKKSEEDHHFLLTLHHSAADGLSFGIIVRELSELYAAFSAGRAPVLPELPIQYADFASWQREAMNGGQFDNELHYWSSKLAGAPPVTELPLDRPRPAVQRSDGAVSRFAFSGELLAQLKELSRQHDATLFMTLLAAFNVLLHRYSGQEDLVVGTIASSRKGLESEQLVGCFLNNLVIRTDVSGNPSFTEMINRVKRNCLEAYSHSNVPFEKVVEMLQPSRSASYNPIFQVLFDVQFAEHSEHRIGDIQVKTVEVDSNTAKLDLFLSMVDLQDSLVGYMEYRTDLFDASTIERMIKHYEQLLTEIAAPDKKLSELEIATPAELEQIMNEFNDTAAAYSKEATLHHLLESQAKRFPNRIAVLFGDQKLTYRELNERANRLARTLREDGVGADTLVGIMAERSLELIVGIYAILKAGGAYVPIDPNFPEERIRYLLTDSGVQQLLVQGQFQERIDFSGTVYDLDDVQTYSRNRSNLAPVSQSNHLAYVIYTSGSTGRPKGVLVEHHSAINRMEWMQKQYPLTGRDVILQKTPVTFDVSVWELFWWTMAGAKVCLLQPQAEREPSEIMAAIRKHKVTTMHFVPSMLHSFLEYAERMEAPQRTAQFKSLRRVFASGEALLPQHAARFRTLLNDAVPVELINLYGPTEATVDVSYFNCKGADDSSSAIPIGKPIHNIRLYIVDRTASRLQPAGASGELCIAGVGLARGYLNRPDLTAEKFVECPFEPGERMYRTGDLARWLPDGNIEYLGRIDQQVKIRGYRIELGEIEAALLAADGMSEAVVVALDDKNGMKQLAAYFIADKALAAAELRNALSRELPGYMVPSYFVQLESMPLTASGKLDRKALPSPEQSIRTSRGYVAPRNEAEAQLAHIWQEVLGLEKVGVHDNFFEIGGHSLRAAALTARIYQTMQREVPLREVFLAPTIEQMSQLIASNDTENYEAIPAAQEMDVYPVSSAQKRLYVLSQLAGGETSYNMPAMLEIEGDLDRARLEESFRKLIQRHETLRTGFEMNEDGEPVQRIHHEAEFALEFLAAAEEDIEASVRSFVQPFDMRQAPLLRARLLQYASQRHILMFDMHHIISDGISLANLVNELVQLYKGEELVPLQLQYKDYAVWQQDEFQRKRLQEQEVYWLRTLGGELPVLDLPTDFARPAMRSFEGGTHTFMIGPQQSESLRQLAMKSGSTLYMVLLAAYSTLLAKYSGQDDVIIGTPVAGRSRAELSPLIGLFVNTVALRTCPSNEKSFLGYVLEIKEHALEAFEHQDYPFEELIEKLNVRRDMSRHPLFDTMFALQNAEQGTIDIDGLSFKPYASEQSTAKFDLTLTAMEDSEGIACSFEYCSALFNAASVERMAGHFAQLIQSIIDEPQAKLEQLEMITAQEKVRIINGFNDTAAEYSKDKTIHQLFEEQAERTPDRIAAVFEDKQLTYKQLNERANRLARTLQSKGVIADQCVGILAERSLEMIVGIMAILKSGGAYVPIDPDYPEERIRYLVEDSEVSHLLVQGHLMKHMSDYAVNLIDLDDSRSYFNDASNLNSRSEPNHLAYVIYTSGSTGKPKGVMIEHHSVINRIAWMQERYPLDERDTILQKTPFTFDVSVWELFWWAMAGAKMCLLSPRAEREPSEIAAAIRKHGVTTMHFVPSMLHSFLEYMERADEEPSAEQWQSLRHVFASGEALPPQHVVRFHKQFAAAGGATKLINLYGPTEATVDVSYYDCNELEYASVPIGKPIHNIRLYIVDRATSKLQPVGVAGELCIAGVGLARGYRNRPELTMDKFTANPFEPGGRMYRTGDLARWLPDGNIEYLGRIDHQVKIRGYRIELGEIEAQLLEVASVQEAVVTAREDGSGAKQLAAYFTADIPLAASELRTGLSRVLPSYMVPSYFVQMAAMPLTASGKLDRKALPAPEESLQSSRAYIAPRNAVEEQLAQIWQKVLGLSKVGVHDHFFEIGGHSLRAAALAARIHKTMGKELPLREVFHAPTIATMAKLITGKQQSNYSAIPIATKQDVYPVSSAQKRLYVLSQLAGGEISYNMPAVFMAEGELNRFRLEEAFKKLIERHETLRTCFELGPDGEPVQRVSDEVPFSMEYAMVISESEAAARLHSFVQPFDLKQAPLLRASMIQIGHESNRHILLFDMHHIISDGVSIALLIDELIQLYEGAELAPLQLQYKDYAVWQREDLQRERIMAQEAFWLDSLGGSLPVLDMPTDYTRPAVRSFEGAMHTFTISERETEGLKQLAARTGATLYMVLLAAYTTLLARYTGQDDMIVGTPAAGRSHAELAPLIGMFVNTLALRSFPSKNKPFVDYVQEIKSHTLQAFDNQDYPYEELIEKLNVTRDMSRNPLFDTMFVLQNAEKGSLTVDGLTLMPYANGNTTAKFDLTLTAAEEESRIACSFEYCSSLFKPDSIRRMAEHWVQLIQSIVTDPQAQLGQLAMITSQEQAQIMDVFNDTSAEYPNKPIQQLFEEQVERTPDHVAVVYEEQRLTYRELNERANRLAWTLRETGVEAGQLVGIMADRSVEMVVGIMAILKAGGAYVPIDPEYPEDRIRFMLDDSGARLLLTQRQYQNRTDYNGTVVLLDQPDSYHASAANLTPCNSAQDLAYVIYTSGTTGRPKGTLIEHRSVVRLLFNSKNLFDFGPGDTWTLFHSFCFDFSVWEMYGALLYGGKLAVVPSMTAKSPKQFAALLHHEEVTVLNQTPSSFYQLMQAALSEAEHRLKLRKVIFGGEALNPYLLRDWKTAYPDTQLINMYGITETTVHVTYKEIGDAEIAAGTSNIGRPIPTLQAYILDEYQRMQPVGVPGELCIAGDGLARGYINRPELTAAKFIDHPFEPGSKMYRSGDLARWMADGNLEYLGRIDHQVKIRGYRIELGEVETQLLRVPSVQEAIVVARQEEDGNHQLAAYFVANAALSPIDLRTTLGHTLPSYMIPAYFIQLDAMPLTRNGKIDRQALPEPSRSFSHSTEYEPPRNELEAQLAQIWQHVLHVPKVGVHDNFFEIGGHSLRAAVLTAQIHQVLHVELPLRELFESPTIAQVARSIASKEKSLHQSIPQAETSDTYPLSSAQKRLYVLSQLAGGETSYNIPGLFLLEGALDRNKLESVFRQLIDRHESLRTSFELGPEGDPVQRVHASAALDLEYMLVNQEEAEQRIRSFMRVFDLGQAPLLRAGLLQLHPQRHILLCDMHHLISDGVSIGNLANEFAALYRGEELPPLRLHYKDYAVWQQGELHREQLHSQERFWLTTLSGELPVLNLPTDYARPAARSFEGRTYTFKVSQQASEGLRRIAERSGSTLYMVLLAAYTAMLAKYSRQEDLIVGTPVAGRSHAELAPLIGMFVNTLALRCFPSERKTFLNYVQELKMHALKAFENQDYPYEELIEKLNIKRDRSRNPLFDTMFALQHTDEGATDIDGLQLKPYAIEQTTAKFDLMLTAIESADGIGFSLEYCSALFKPDTIERMSRHFMQLLEAIVCDPDAELSKLSMLTGEEKSLIQDVFNDTAADYPSDSTIQQLFEYQAATTPEAIAVVYGEEQITYRELNIRANRLAHALRNEGVQRDEVVGLIAEPSIGMIVGVLAILKAGGAYLPLDTQYPESRIAFMLADSGARILIKQQAIELGDAIFTGTAMELTANGNAEAADTELSATEHNPSNRNTANDLAYVMYTSGTTGKPKGVMIEHRSVIRLVNNTNYIAIAPTDRLLQTGSFGFDATTFELFGALLNGASLHLIAKDELLDPARLSRHLEQNSITVIWLTSSLFNHLAEEHAHMFAGLRYLLVGGEALSPKHINKVRELAPALTVINGYGPTENTTFSVCYPIDRTYGQSIPIGRPIANSTAYILDAQGQLQPVGVAGELCVGGAGVARGYLNRPDLAAEKFVDNPYRPGERMYKTGDLARWLEDGKIEYLGRLDTQVKIRGYRIEPGEIENEIQSLPSVRKAAVFAHRESNGTQSLAAYVVTFSAADLDTASIRDELSRRLPEYMVPAYIVAMEQLPLTANGKVDRHALPAPETGAVTSRKYEAARNVTEAKLISIWQQVLGRERIGALDHFFELGGHSISAMQVISRLRSAFGIQVPLRLLFEQPTVAAMAEAISATEQASGVSFETGEAHNQPRNAAEADLSIVPRENGVPLSYVQQRLWFLHQLDPASAAYHIFAAVAIHGSLDKRLLKQCIDQLAERHETLRTIITESCGAAVQLILGKMDIPLPEVDMRHMPRGSQENEVKRLARLEESQPFDLQQGPLWRIRLLTLSEQEHVLFITMHHVISDGWSISVLVSELGQLYAARAQGLLSLPAMPIQYADYAVWQNGKLNGPSGDRLTAYWMKQLEGELPALELPRDYARPDKQTYRGGHTSISVPQQTVRRLKELGQQREATLFMTLLSAFAIQLSRLSAQHDIIVGTPIAGRTHADSEHLIGCFVNTLALRIDTAGNPTFSELLDQARKVCLDAYDHQDMPFEKLVELLQPERSLSRNPIFDVMINLVNTPDSQASLDDLDIVPLELGDPQSKFAMTLYIRETESDLQLEWVYQTDLFSRERMEELARQYASLLDQIGASGGSERMNAYSLVTADSATRLPDPLQPMDKPAFKTAAEMFFDTAERHPDATAIVHRGERRSYGELSEAVRRTASRLAGSGIRRGETVALYGERSFGLIAGLLGVMAAGGVILTLDRTLPEERRHAVLTASGAKHLIYAGARRPEDETLLTSTDWSSLWFIDESAQTSQAEELDSERLACPQCAAWSECSEHADQQPLQAAAPDDPAYLFFTSGTTGTPKGVLGRNAGLSHFLAWQRSTFGVGPGDRGAQLTGLSFDVVLRDLLLPLTSGAAICLPDEAEDLSASRILPWMEEQQITYLHTVPALAQSWLGTNKSEAAVRPSALPSLRAVFFAGEPLTASLIEAWRASFGDNAEIVNLYGPTETTLAKCWYLVPRTGPLPSVQPIGQPLPDTQVLVLNADGKLCGIGEPGELVIRTPFRSLGYVNQDSHASRFARNPFTNDPEDIVYYTGDLGAYRPDGLLTIAGRTDDQIKIRGMRVDTGDIQAMLAAHPQVKEAFVTPYTATNGDAALAAYISAKEGEGTLDAAVLRAYAKAKLISYMVPRAIVILDELPLTPNGKIDRRKLPDPASYWTDGLEQTYVAPRTSIELTISGIWQELLGVPQAGMHDNFFDLGGHSLLLLQVKTKLTEALGRDIPVVDLFRYPTISSLADWINSAEPTNRIDLTVSNDRASMRKLALQQRRERARNNK